MKIKYVSDDGKRSFDTKEEYDKWFEEEQVVKEKKERYNKEVAKARNLVEEKAKDLNDAIDAYTKLTGKKLYAETINGKLFITEAALDTSFFKLFKF